MLLQFISDFGDEVLSKYKNSVFVVAVVSLKSEEQQHSINYYRLPRTFSVCLKNSFVFGMQPVTAPCKARVGDGLLQPSFLFSCG